MLIAFYNFQLWYFKRVPLFHPLKELKMQYKVVLWITNAFQTSLLQRVKAITSLISIHLHLNKSSKRHHLKVVSLSKQYAINLLLDNQYSKKAKPHYLLIGNLTDKQCLKIKSSIVDTKNHLNKVHPFFNRLYKELLSRFNLVDNFLITSHFIQ